MGDAFAPDGVLSIGQMPKEEALERLALIDEKAALEFEHEDPPYKHSSHVFGFISSNQSTAELSDHPTCGDIETRYEPQRLQDQRLAQHPERRQISGGRYT